MNTASNNLGTIKLNESSSIVFSVSIYNNKQYANIRKFISSPKYSGPTKSGLFISENVLASILKILNKIKEDIPNKNSDQIDKINKSKESDIIISIIPPDNSKSLPSIDIREFIESEKYTGFTKKGIRFPWDKLNDVVLLFESIIKTFKETDNHKPSLFPNNQHEELISEFEAFKIENPEIDSLIKQIIPDGLKQFPKDFLKDNIKKEIIELPVEPIFLTQLPDGSYTMKSEFGFSYKVKNISEGNYIYYAFLQGFKLIDIPIEMIEIFKVVKAYENYTRNFRQSLIKSYEHRSGNLSLAIHKSKEIFVKNGLPWL